MNQVQQRRAVNVLLQTKTSRWLITLLLFFLISTPSNSQSRSSHAGDRYEISGTVFEKDEAGKINKLEFATVSISEYAMGASTDSNGRFVLKAVPSGKARLKVQYVGKVNIDTVINVNRNISLSLVMSMENFRLADVVVTAVNSQAGQSTASRISRNAIDHLQSTSLSDLMSLLPGGLTANQNLNAAKQVTIRNVSSESSDANAMNAFGVSIIKDGAPISNNANLQTMNPTVAGGIAALSGGTPPSGGTDLRLLSTDNVESIEVIRGIPSVQYGDLTSGAVIVNSKAGKTPLRVRVKANPNVYEVSAGSGFSLGERKGALNVSGDYAYNTNNPVQSYRTYQRSNIKVMYSNKFFNRLNSNTSIDLMYGADRNRLNPDDEKTKFETQGDNVGVTLNTNGTFRVDKPWLSNIKYTGSVSYTSKKSYMSQQYVSATSPYSMTTVDGAILSNKPGVDIFDKDGNKITQIPTNDRLSYATELPDTYIGRYDIDGKEINAFIKVVGNLYKRIGNTNHSLMFGADFKSDGNEGDGKTFSQTAPPYRNLGAVNASFRPRSYKDIPYVNQLGVFVQEAFKYDFGNRELNITAGLRYDNISVVNDVFSPRINASLEVLPNTLFLRAGYGVTAKAPSMLFLHPEPAYFEYVNINDLWNEKIPQEDRLLITTTRIFDAQNKDLKIARNKKAEIGFDLKINQATLAVTAFHERLIDGYSMSTAVNTFKPVTYDQYARTTEGLVLSESNPVLAKYYTPTNNLQVKTKGVEFDLNLGRFDVIRTAFSVNGMWIRNQSYSSDYTYFDDYSGTSGKGRTHISLYEKGMVKNNNQRFTSTLRVTHNIPEIGFVVTLTGQAIWNETQWYDWGNDTTPVKYISKDDGKVYNFSTTLINQNDPNDPFKLLLRKVDDKQYIKEKYPSAYTFNINVTKELGEYMRVSFFANNMFRSYPSVRSKRTPSTYLIRKQSIFFGLELSLTL